MARPIICNKCDAYIEKTDSYMFRIQIPDNSDDMNQEKIDLCRDCECELIDFLKMRPCDNHRLFRNR